MPDLIGHPAVRTAGSGSAPAEPFTRTGSGESEAKPDRRASKRSWDRNMRKGIGELIINNYFCGDLRFRNALQ